MGRSVAEPWFRIRDHSTACRRCTGPAHAQAIERISHILGICGTFMGGIAAIAREAGLSG
jgi:hypothetical protein